jgi:uncharacterized metal-binding protein YceD (DUF177 family)
MNVKKEYVIPFEGLKIGKHAYSFLMTDAFFEDLEYSLIERGEIKANMVLDKKETMMTAEIQLKGFVWSECDLCNEPLKVDMNIDHHLVFKFGESESEDENLLMVEPSEFEIDMAPIFYELLAVSLPNKKVHDEGDCNEDMLDLLDKYSGSDDDEDDGNDGNDGNDDDIDPRWKALKNLN